MSDSLNRRWFDGFFEGLVVDMWKIAASPEQTLLEADFLERELQLKQGDKALDAPCGFGRHALELARRGYQMTGLDLSPSMIKEAEQSPASETNPVVWLLADMRDIPWEAEFDAGYCCGNSFGYMDSADTLAFLKAMARSLKRGGRFALDFGLTAESILPRLPQREEVQVGDILFQEESLYHIRESCIETTYTLIRGDERVQRTGIQWVFTVREVIEMLAEAGFRTEALYSSLDKCPFEVGAFVLYVVTVKE